MPWHGTPEWEGTRLCGRERDFVRVALKNRGCSDTELANPEVMRDFPHVLEDNRNSFSFPDCDCVGVERPFGSFYRYYVRSFLFADYRAKASSRNRLARWCPLRT